MMIFDMLGDDELPDATERVPVLVVPAPIPPDMLLEVETAFRMRGRVPIMFTACDDDGAGEVFENRDTIASYLGVSPAGLTIERAEMLLSRKEYGQPVA